MPLGVAFAELDEDRVAAGLDGVEQAAPQQLGVAAAAPAVLERGARARAGRPRRRSASSRWRRSLPPAPAPPCSSASAPPAAARRRASPRSPAGPASRRRSSSGLRRRLRPRRARRSSRRDWPAGRAATPRGPSSPSRRRARSRARSSQASGRLRARPALGDRHPVVDFPGPHPFDRLGQVAVLDRPRLRRALDLVEAVDLGQVAEGGRLDGPESSSPRRRIRPPRRASPTATCRAGIAARSAPTTLRRNPSDPTPKKSASGV